MTHTSLLYMIASPTLTSRIFIDGMMGCSWAWSQNSKRLMPPLRVIVGESRDRPQGFCRKRGRSFQTEHGRFVAQASALVRRHAQARTPVLRLFFGLHVALPLAGELRRNAVGGQV